MNGFRGDGTRKALVCLVLVALMVLAGSSATAAVEKKAGESGRVDLNKASREQLMEVKGIGPALAGRIIDFRKEHGPFKRVEDILKVRGVGEKSLAKLRPYLKVTQAGS